MDVLASVERLNQCRVFGEVGQNPKLDLRVVRRQKGPVRCSLSDERLTHLTSKLGSHRDVLHVGVVAGHPTCRRAHLVVLGVNPARVSVNQPRQGIHVSGFDLR